MDINAIVKLYNSRELDAQQAFELLKKDKLLAEAFMGMLSHYHQDRDALLALCPPSGS